jgi:uncharacterized protein (DUF433 family)
MHVTGVALPSYNISIIVAPTKKSSPCRTPASPPIPSSMMGKPCIKVTRMTAELILRELGAGRSFADLLDTYPRLAEEDLRAALAFAADYMEHETVLPAG